MSFAYFFLAASLLILVATLFLLRNRDGRLRPFGVAASVTVLTLLAGSVLRLLDRAAVVPKADLLVDTVTAASFSAALVLLVAWTVRLPPASR